VKAGILTALLPWGRLIHSTGSSEKSLVSRGMPLLGGLLRKAVLWENAAVQFH
jgi:hypothetical protein